MTLQTVPAGLDVVYDGEIGTTPRTVQTPANSTHTLYGPSPQGQQNQEHSVAGGLGGLVAETLSDSAWIGHDANFLQYLRGVFAKLRRMTADTEWRRTE